MPNLPQNEEAERAVLAGMMKDHNCIPDVMARLDRESFLDPDTRRVFEAIVALHQRAPGGAIEPGLVRDELARTHPNGDYNECLDLIAGSLVSMGSLEYYLKIVQRTHAQRQFIVHFGDLLRQAQEQKHHDPRELLDAADVALSAMRNRLDGRQQKHTDMMTLLQEEMDRIAQRMDGKPDGTIGTGLPSLDRMLDGGVRPGELVIVAGRPGSGKTSLADTIIHHTTLMHSIPAAYFSLEMGQSQIARRLMALRSAVPVASMRRKPLPQEYAEMLGVVSDMGSKPIHVRDATLYKSALALRSEAFRLHRQHSIKLVVIDHLTLMHFPGKPERRDLEIGQITGAMKGLSKDINCPILLLCQLNRSSAYRNDKRPKLTDLRDSGNIEQDADVVIMLHREDEEHKDDAGWVKTNQADVIIAKQRDGKTGMFQLHFHGPTMGFSEISYAEDTTNDNDQFF